MTQDLMKQLLIYCLTDFGYGIIVFVFVWAIMKILRRI